jgi:hypothetical protein
MADKSARPCERMCHRDSIKSVSIWRVRTELSILICRRSRLQFIPNRPSGRSALVLALVLSLRRFFHRNGNRDRADLCELVYVCRRCASVDATLICQLPREACDLAIVQFPFWDLARARKLGLFL